MSNKNVITRNDTEEIKAIKAERRELDTNKFRLTILNMCMNKDFREYFITKLKSSLFKRNSDLKAGDPECTGYNLGKSDAYKEMLFDIQDAAEIATDEEKEIIAEILRTTFFNE